MNSTPLLAPRYCLDVYGNRMPASAMTRQHYAACATCNRDLVPVSR